ncbi:MAG: hypothetical protein JRN15_13135 [Nitrososphaerota archaeon]|jgi:uncharacterized membrane protein HdeD (DUF308 family)|nr:hypothetical protein [Nitrososphaerota archaeon]
MKSETKHSSRRAMKYPLFILGLVVMIAGGLVVTRYAYSLDAEVITIAVGFVLMVAGILLE